MADTGMMTALLGRRPSDFIHDADKAGKAFETFVYCQLTSEIDAAAESYHLYQYRDHDKREIDFLVERDDRSLLGIEVKSGITVKKRLQTYYVVQRKPGKRKPGYRYCLVCRR